MQFVRHGLLAAVALALSACGGGNPDPPPTRISVSPTSVSFSAEAGEALPASQTVTITWVGDGIVAGYPPEVELPTWLDVYELSYSDVDRTATYQLSVNQVPANSQTLQTTLRFLTGRVRGEDVYAIKTFDLPVQYQVTPSTFVPSVSPLSLSFRAASGGQLPATRTLQVDLSDGTLVSVQTDYPWLSATAGTPSGSSVAIDVAVTSTAYTPASFNGQVTLTLQRPSGTQRTLQVPVSYTVVQPLSVAPSALSFIAMRGRAAAPTPATRTFAIAGSDLQWEATSDQAWLALQQTAGMAPGNVGFTLDHTGLAPGIHTAKVTVHDAFGGFTRYVEATLEVTAAQLVVAPTTLAFALDAASDEADLAGSVTVGDETDGVDAAHSIPWTVSASADWLVPSVTSGGSTPAATLGFTLDKVKLAELGNGIHAATATLAYDDAAGVPHTKTVSVTLDLAVPRAARIAPYTAIAGRAGNAYVRGTGFTGLPEGALTIGGVAPTSVEVVSDTTLSVAYPALDEGRYAVSIDNVLEAELSEGELVVLAARDRPYAAFPAVGQSWRLVFDDERETLYVVNNGTGYERLERYRVVDGAWTQLDPIAIPKVDDAALSPDGHALLISGGDKLYTLDLDDPLAEPVQVYNTNSECSRYYTLAVANDGHALVVVGSYCFSGMHSILDWDLATGAVSLFPYPASVRDGFGYASADGSVAWLGYERRYDALTSTLSDNFLFTPSPKQVSAVNADGSLLADTRYGYDAAFNPLAAWHDNHMLMAFGHLADRAYGVRRFDEDAVIGTNVLVFDTSDRTPEGGYFPVLRQVEIPAADMPSVGGTQFEMPRTVSADDRTYFLRGPDKLVIVPVGDP